MTSASVTQHNFSGLVDLLPDQSTRRQVRVLIGIHVSLKVDVINVILPANCTTAQYSQHVHTAILLLTGKV
jgi:hypothetical protein